MTKQAKNLYGHKVTTVPRLLTPESWDYVIGALRVAQRSTDPNDAGEKAIWETIRCELLAQDPAA